MFKPRSIPIVIGFILWSTVGFSQTPEIDSLRVLVAGFTPCGGLGDTLPAKWETKIGSSFLRKGAQDSCIAHTARAIVLLDKISGINTPNRSIESLKCMAWKFNGRANVLKDNQLDALFAYQKYYGSAEILGSAANMGVAMDYMGTVLANMRDPDGARVHHLAAIALLETEPSGQDLAIAHGNLAVVYTEMGESDSALFHLRNARPIIARYSHPMNLVQADLNMAENFLRSGQLDSAEYYLNLTEPKARELNHPPHLGKLMYLRSDLAVGRNELEKARQNATKALDIARDLGNPGMISAAAARMVVAESGLGDTAAANRMSLVSDSGLIEHLHLDKVRQVAVADLEFIRQKEAKIAKQELLIAQSRSLLLFVILISTGVILALLVYQIWRARKNARILTEKNGMLVAAQHELVSSEKKREAEQVRTRIARDIHDEMGGELTKIRLLGGEVKHLLRTDPLGADQAVERISRSAQQASDALHDIVWATDPHYDTSKGLVDHARDLAQRMMERSGLNVTMDFQHHGEDRQLDTVWKQHMLRILKEALNNIVKHAHATAVEVSLSVDPEEFTLRVQDNGSGFDPGGHALGNGLRNIKARATAMGADLAMSGAEEGGCTLALHGPVPVAEYH